MHIFTRTRITSCSKSFSVCLLVFFFFHLISCFCGAIFNSKGRLHQRRWACVCFRRQTGDRREKGGPSQRQKRGTGSTNKDRKKKKKKSKPSHILVNQSAWIWRSQMTPKFRVANVSQITRLRQTELTWSCFKELGFLRCSIILSL